MKVLYFTRSYTSHDFRFLEAILEAGHEALVLQLEARRAAPESRPWPPGVQRVAWRRPRERYRRWQIPGRVADLRRIFEETRADVVHAGPVQTCGLLAALGGARSLVIMSWGSDLLWDARRWLPRVEAKIALRRADAFIGDCLAVRESARRLGVPESKMVIFPWGVDLSQFSPGDDGGVRTRLGWEGHFVVLSARALEPLYGVDLLAQAFASAAKADPEMRLLLLGQGSLRPHLQAIFEHHGIGGQVHFAGQVDYANLPAFYRSCDVYVTTSHSDGSSVSLLEAMACGRPVVASDIPGNREWVEAGKNGWLFADGDALSLRKALLEARSARALLLQLGASSRQIAEAKADWINNRRGLSKAYDIAMARGKRGP